MGSVTVFAGSADGHDPRWRQAAYDLGSALARRGHTLVYGAGGRGLMGAVAQGALDLDGAVVGVIPAFMVEREWGRQDLGELVVVDTMHERKAVMCERADAVIALPGGLGTLEELIEIWSWVNLAFVSRPLGLLNIGGYWDPLIALADHLVASGFMSAAATDALVVRAGIEECLAAVLPDGRAEFGL